MTETKDTLHDGQGAPARATPRWLVPGSLAPRHAWLIAGLIALMIGWRYFWTEGRPSTQVIAIGATLLVAAGLATLLRRVLAPVLLTGMLVLLINLIADFKLRSVNLVLHAYDLVFYASDWPTLKFLLTDFWPQVLALGLALCGTAFLGWLAFRLDATRPRRRHALVATGLAGLLTWGGVVGMGERRHSQFEYEGQYVSSFVLSWSETIETLAKGQLIDAASASTGEPRFATPASCTPAEKPPHIILIHQESVVPPEYFPTLKYDRSIDPFFRSFDGRLHRMRVETYGGNSAMTEFSLLTGVSTRSFGGMRQFVQTIMAGKIGDTLPQALARCGYRNVMFYPMLRNFVQTSRFFAGVGLNEMFDMKDQGAKTTSERDGFYYGNALAEMERHFASSQQPLFTFIETMSTHWPYHVTFWPDIYAPGGAAGTDPEMHEYLRRLSLARMDFEAMTREIKRRFPNERFLIVQYGDHHPMATRTLLNYTDGTEAEDVVIPPDSVGFNTYFAINGINYQPAPLPRQDLIDVPYLGAITLQSAHLPLSDAFKARLKLMEICKGRYHDCAQKEAVLSFHRRLIESDLMQAR